MFNSYLDRCRNKMSETLEFLKRDIDSISTGRATPNLLDPVKVELYGSLMPLNQLSSISVPDATTLAIQVWDNSSIKAIEKAIIDSNLGFSPAVDGSILRIKIPKLSQERRQEMVKLAKKYGEDKKVSVRNIRRDIIDSFKKEEGDSSKDSVHSFTDAVQKVTDDFVAKIDEIVAKKEKDLMSI